MPKPKKHTDKDPSIDKLVATNRKARYNYHIVDTYEAGIVLQGTEVKSCREGKVSFIDSFCDIDRGEVFVRNMHISPYEKGNIWNHAPKQSRKLLLHKREIKKLTGSVTQKGFTLIPLRAYFKNGRLKIQIGLAKGKRTYDKREDIKRRDVERELDRYRKQER